MTEKEIRDRIKTLEAELRSLKAQLPKKERTKRKPIESTSDSFMRMANKIVNARRAE